MASGEPDQSRIPDLINSTIAPPVNTQPSCQPSVDLSQAANNLPQSDSNQPQIDSQYQLVSSQPSSLLPQVNSQPVICNQAPIFSTNQVQPSVNNQLQCSASTQINMVSNQIPVQLGVTQPSGLPVSEPPTSTVAVPSIASSSLTTPSVTSPVISSPTTAPSVIVPPVAVPPVSAPHAKVHKHKDEKHKKEDKSVTHVLKALNSLNTTEEKLAALCKKYADIFDENRKLQLVVKQSEKKVQLIHREKEQLQTEHSKAILTRSRLENLCRELQRRNKAIKEDSIAKMREEEEKRSEISAKFQNTLSEITALMQQNNDKNNKLRDDNIDMTSRLKSVCEQYQLREQQVEKLSKQMELEVQLCDAKLTKAKMEMTAEKEILLREKQQLLLELTTYQNRCQELQGIEVDLRSQIAMYNDKYDEFQQALSKSSQVFSGFKMEMEKMSKKITKLEKETSSWKQRWEQSHQAVLEMASEKQTSEQELRKVKRQLNALQSLCRTLQTERSDLLATVEKLSGKGSGEPVPPINVTPIDSIINVLENDQCNGELEKPQAPLNISDQDNKCSEKTVNDTALNNQEKVNVVNKKNSEINCNSKAEKDKKCDSNSKTSAANKGSSKTCKKPVSSNENELEEPSNISSSLSEIEQSCKIINDLELKVPLDSSNQSVSVTSPQVGENGSEISGPPGTPCCTTDQNKQTGTDLNDSAQVTILAEESPVIADLAKSISSSPQPGDANGVSPNPVLKTPDVPSGNSPNEKEAVPKSNVNSEQVNLSPKNEKSASNVQLPVSKNLSPQVVSSASESTVKACDKKEVKPGPEPKRKEPSKKRKK